MYASLSVISSLQIPSKDRGAPANSDCFGKTGWDSELFTFDRVFSFSLKGKCVVRDKSKEWGGKNYFITLTVMTSLWTECIHIHSVCSLLVDNEQIDLHTKRSGSGNPTPLPCCRTDLAIWSHPSGRGIIWLMALIITALLQILLWLWLCVFVRVIPLSLIPRGKTSYLKHVGVPPSVALSLAVTNVEVD